MIGRLGSLVVTLAFASGCYTMNASLPGTLRGDLDPERDVEKVGEVSAEVNHWFIPCGLGAAPETTFRKELLEQARAQGADGVANMKFEAQGTFFDVVVGTVCPVLGPRTYRLSGDLVRIKKPPLGGLPPGDAPPGGQVTVDKDDEPRPPDVAVAY